MAKTGGSKRVTGNNYVSPVPDNVSADFLVTAQRLAGGQAFYPGWRFYQRDTGVHYTLRPLADCFLSDGTTPATQNGTWGTVDDHWIPEVTAEYVLEAVAEATQAVGGNLTPGKVAYVEGNPSNDLAPRLGDPLRPYQTLAAAANAAGPEGLVVVRPGGAGVDSLGRPCYNESTVVLSQNVNIFCLPGVVFSSNLNGGAYGGTATNLRITWFGGIILNQISGLRQVNSAYHITLINVKTEGLGVLQAFSQCPGGSASTHTDVFEMRDCWGRNTGSGGAALTGNENFGFQRTLMIDRNGDWETTGGPSLRITPHTAVQANASQFIRRGSSRFASGAGNPIMIGNAAISGPVNPDYVLLDERPVPDVPANLYGAGPLQLIAVSGSKKTWAIASGGGGTPAPTISGASPNSGYVGSTSTLTGTNFATPSAFTLGGTAITTYTVNGATSITFTVPAGATTGAISITIGGQTATSTGSFTVTKFQDSDIGDSLTEGYGLGGSYMTLNWSYRLGVVGADVYDQVLNKGVSGDTTAMMLARLSNITSSFNATGRAGIHTHTLGGVNDFDETKLGATVSDVVGRLAQLATGYKAAQVNGRDKNYLLTMTATAGYYTSVPGGSAEMDARVTVKINDLNAYIRANYVAMGYDGFVDIARIPEAQDPTNSAYTSDGLHWTAFLANLVAQAVAAYQRTGAQPTGPIISNAVFVAPAMMVEPGANVTLLTANANGSRAQATVDDGQVGSCAYTSLAIDAGDAEFVLEDMTEKVFGFSESAITGFGGVRYGGYQQTNGNFGFFGVNASTPTPISGGPFTGLQIGDVIKCVLGSTTVTWFQNGVQKAVFSRNGETMPQRAVTAMSAGITAIRWKAAAYIAPVA